MRANAPATVAAQLKRKPVRRTSNPMPLDLTPLEQQILERSQDSTVTIRRRRMVVVAGLFAAVAFWYLFAVMESPSFAFFIVLLYLGVTVFEKWAYANAVLGYKSLIRKLSSRVEELEQLGDRPSDFDAV